MKPTFKTASRSITIDFTVSGYSYNRKKENAKRLAKEIAPIMHEFSGTQRETIGIIMERIGRKFGLLSEFRKSGIC